MEGQRHLSDLETENTGHSPADLKVLWQSVDYSLLSTPTPPGSPRSHPRSNDFLAGIPDFFMSPSRLFEMASENDIFAPLPLLDETLLMPGSGELDI
jgi:hypothetical protein